MVAYMLCPCCKQPLPNQKRAGLYLPPRKAQIFDAIDRHPGLSTLDIITKCYQGNGTPNAVRVHVAQMNCLFMEAGLPIRIRGDGIALRGSYRIIRLNERTAA